jgi:hypothetical protein
MRQQSALALGAVTMALLAGVSSALFGAVPAPPDVSEIRFTIRESALLDWLDAVTPYTLTIGREPLSLDLVLSEPRDLRLADGRATLRIRAKGRTLPFEQILSPVFTVRFDQKSNRYFVVVSSLPIQVPGLGRIDLKDSFPRLEIPELLENLWRFADKPVGLNLNIRRIGIIDHAVEVGADVSFAPLASAVAAIPPGGRHGR